jgi:uncharacterized protein YwqG
MTPEQARLFSDGYLARAEAVQSEFPLAFLAQLDLRVLSAEPGFDPIFPDHGRLLFFYDSLETPAEYDPCSIAGFRLIWDASPVTSLTRKMAPEALIGISDEEWSCLLKSATVTAQSVVTPIPLNDKLWAAFSLDDDDAYEAYHDWLDQFGTPDDANGINHQLGGWPRPLQNGMQARSQLASHGIYCGTQDAYETESAKELLKGAKAWRLVLQIGVDEPLGLFSVGCLYVLMREEDIRARAFNRAWFVYQCD